MKITRILALGLANLFLLGGCASVQPPHGRHNAVVMGYREISYNISHPESGFVRLLQVDHRTIDDPRAPLRLKPGRHVLLVSCIYVRPWVRASDPSVALTLDVTAGTRYQLYPTSVTEENHTACRVGIKSTAGRRQTHAGV